MEMMKSLSLIFDELHSAWYRDNLQREVYYNTVLICLWKLLTISIKGINEYVCNVEKISVEY